MEIVKDLEIAISAIEKLERSVTDQQVRIRLEDILNHLDIVKLHLEDPQNSELKSGRWEFIPNNVIPLSLNVSK